MIGHIPNDSTNEPPVDDETERLLAEMQNAGNARAALEARAKELGVKFQPNIGDKKLGERIAKAEAKLKGKDESKPNDDPVVDRDESRVLTNVGRNHYGLGEVTIVRGGEHYLTNDELADGDLMAKVDRAVGLGMLSRGGFKTDEPLVGEPIDSSDVVTNLGRNPHSIGGITIIPGESHTLTEANMADETLMAKVNRAVELGILSRGSD